MRRLVTTLTLVLLVALPTMVSASASPCANSGAALMVSVSDRLNINDASTLFDALSCEVRVNYANLDAREDRLQTALQLGRYGTAASDASALRALDRARFDALVAETGARADTDSDALTLLGLLHWADARDDLALQEFQALLSQQPTSVFAILFRGSSRLYSGDSVASVADFQQAVNLDPGNPDVYSIIGSTHQQVGNVFDALMALDRALELNPQDARSHYFRGMALLDHQDLYGARDELSAAVSHDPSYLDAWYDRARVNYLLTDQSAALSDLNQALAINPGFDLALTFRGALYEWSGQRELAASDFFAYTRVSAPSILSSGALGVNSPATVQLNAGLLYAFTFEGNAGDLVQLSAEATQADPLLIVLGPDGQTPIAGSDDAAPTMHNALISSLTLPQSGVYTVLVTQSDSPQTGAAVVTLSMP